MTKTQEELKEIVKAALNSDLGKQCLSLYTTSDGEVFIRFMECISYYEETKNGDRSIKEWCKGDNEDVILIFAYPSELIWEKHFPRIALSSEIDEQRAKTVETICIGIVAKNMGYANVSQVCNAGKEVFQFIKGMSYKQFRDIKKLR